MEWDYPEIWCVLWQSRWLSHLSGAISMVHEKPGDYLHQNRSCTHNRIRSPRWIASGRCDNVGKGSRQIRSVTSGKRLALRAGRMRLGIEVNYFRRLASSSGQAEWSWFGWWIFRDAFGRSLRIQQLTENWRGQGESDCLIKTKHSDGRKRCWQNVISAQCSECQSDEIQLSAGKRRE